MSDSDQDWLEQGSDLFESDKDEIEYLWKRVNTLKTQLNDAREGAIGLGQKLGIVLGLNDDEIQFLKSCGGVFEDE